MAINQKMIRMALDNLKEAEREYMKPSEYRKHMPSKLNNRKPAAGRMPSFENRVNALLEMNASQSDITRQRVQNQREWNQFANARREKREARKELKKARNADYGTNYRNPRHNINVDMGGAPRYSLGKLNAHAPIVRISTEAGPVSVNRSVAGRFKGFINALNGPQYDIHSLGGYANRNIAGTNSRSLHSYGLAIDINPGQNPVTYGRRVTDLPPGVSALAAKYGLVWGGDWNGSKKDTMHFSVPWGGRK